MVFWLIGSLAIFWTLLHLTRPLWLGLRRLSTSLGSVWITWTYDISGLCLAKYIPWRRKYTSSFLDIGVPVALFSIPICLLLVARQAYLSVAPFLQHRDTVARALSKRFHDPVTYEDSAQQLRLLLPGVTLPLNQLPSYVLSALLAAVTHEVLGHAMAASM